MTRSVVIVSFRADVPVAEADAWLAAADRLPNGSAGRHLPGSVGPADASWDLAEPEDPRVAELLRADVLQEAERLALDPVAAVPVPLDGPRVKRTLVLGVRPAAGAAELERFERSLCAMPAHIGTIRSWSLSRVPGSRWTHVWEQEFADEAGLRGEYLHHPYHWTGVERWFDPEIPGSIVDPMIVHAFRWAPGPIV